MTCKHKKTSSRIVNFTSYLNKKVLKVFIFLSYTLQISIPDCLQRKCLKTCNHGLLMPKMSVFGFDAWNMSRGQELRLSIEQLMPFTNALIE